MNTKDEKKKLESGLVASSQSCQKKSHLDPCPPACVHHSLLLAIMTVGFGKDEGHFQSFPNMLIKDQALQG